MDQGFKFCPACAAPLEVKKVEGTLRPVCPACGRVVYHDPKVAAVTIVSRGPQVLLVRRNNQPGYGLWSVPGGYVDRGEDVEVAAQREVFEETGLVIRVDRLIGVFSEPGKPVIVIAYAGEQSGGELAAGPEAMEVAYFALDQLPTMAFPGDFEILNRWAQQESE